MFDLRMHTSHSDGSYTTAEFLKKCEELGLKMISITDHNRTGAYKDLKDPEIRKLFSGEILIGCEISSHLTGTGIEILAYGADPERLGEEISQFFSPDDQYLRRFKSAANAIKAYKERGILLNEERIWQNHADITHIGRVLWIEVNLYPENRKRYLYPQSEYDFLYFSRKEYGYCKSPFFNSIAEFRPDPKTVCDIIHKLGGKAIIAHPGAYSDEIYTQLENLIQEAKPDGLAAWYGTHTPEQREYLLGLCKKYNLIYSGGSDFHRSVPEGHPRRLGVPKLKEIYPTEEIYTWAKELGTI